MFILPFRPPFQKYLSYSMKQTIFFRLIRQLTCFRGIEGNHSRTKGEKNHENKEYSKEQFPVFGKMSDFPLLVKFLTNCFQRFFSNYFLQKNLHIPAVFSWAHEVVLQLILRRLPLPAMRKPARFKS